MRNHYRRNLTILLLLATAACAPQPPVLTRYMSNRGATQEQFMQDRYACYQEAQPRMPAPYPPPYGAPPSPPPPVNMGSPMCGAFAACMAARGYYSVNTTNPDDFKIPGSLIVPASARFPCRAY